MEKKIDFSKLSNSEINLKKMGYDNEYKAKRDKVVSLILQLEELDRLYIEADNELKRRGVLNDG